MIEAEIEEAATGTIYKQYPWRFKDDHSTLDVGVTYHGPVPYAHDVHRRFDWNEEKPSPMDFLRVPVPYHGVQYRAYIPMGMCGPPLWGYGQDPTESIEGSGLIYFAADIVRSFRSWYRDGFNRSKNWSHLLRYFTPPLDLLLHPETTDVSSELDSLQSPRPVRKQFASCCQIQSVGMQMRGYMWMSIKRSVDLIALFRRMSPPRWPRDPLLMGAMFPNTTSSAYVGEDLERIRRELWYHGVNSWGIQTPYALRPRDRWRYQARHTKLGLF